MLQGADVKDDGAVWVVSLPHYQNLPMMVSCEKSIKALGQEKCEETCKTLAILAHVMYGTASAKEVAPETLR